MESLGLTGKELFSIEGMHDELIPGSEVTVRAEPDNRKAIIKGKKSTFQAVVRLDTPIEVQYYRNGGILHTVLRNMLKDNPALR